MKNFLQSIKAELSRIFSTKVQSDNGRRITWLDMSKGFAILLVVMGHRGFISPECNVWLSTFHLPTFFIISGFLLAVKKEHELPFKVIFEKKLSGIAIPYIVFSIFSLLYDLTYIIKNEMTFSDIKNHLLDMILLKGISVLWFLPVIFFAELFTLFLAKRFRRLFPLVSLVLAAAAYYVYVKLSVLQIPARLLDFAALAVKCLIATVFICGGFLFSSLKLSSKRFCLWETIAGLALFGLNIFAAFRVGIFDFNGLNLPSLFIYLFLGFSGGLGLLLLMKNVPNLAPLTYFGINSLIVMCTHMNLPVLYFGTILAMHFCQSPDNLHVLNFLTMLFSFLLEIPLIYVINTAKQFFARHRKTL